MIITFERTDIVKKKITLIFLTFLLIMPFGSSFNVSAATDQPAEHAAAYYLDKTLYSFVNPYNESEFLNTKINFLVDDTLNEVNAHPTKLTDTDTLVSYMFLIDASTSMSAYKEKVHSIADGLLNNEKQNVSVSVATMGEKFDVIEENITGKEHALEVINKIQYIQNASEICDGILDAISYLKDKTPQPGELMNIVVITDGDVYMSDTGRSPEAISRIANATKTIIEDISEITIHTVCFGEWSATTYDAVSSGSGIDRMVYSSSAAIEAGSEIASFVDGFCLVKIPYYRSDLSKRFDAQLVVSSPDYSFAETIELYSIRNMNVDDSIVVPLFDEDGNLIPRKPSNASPEGEEDTTESTEESTEGATENTTDEVTATSNTIGEITTNPTTPENESTNFLLIIVIAAAVIILVAVLSIIIAKRLNSKKSKPINMKSSPSIRIQLDVVCGTLKSADIGIKLYDELFIGSGNKCDIVFNDENIAEKNTRVFLKDGIVYIEDLNEISNTYLGGMKIYSPNRLRSGDEISIGSTSFTLRF